LGASFLVAAAYRMVAYYADERTFFTDVFVADDAGVQVV
jgi:hypothetical protein